MKVIKIKTAVNLSSGLTTPPNTILTIAECYTNNKDKKINEIPAQIATLLYLNEAAIETKESINGISDFSSLFNNLSLSITDYATKTAESLAIDTVYNELVPIYTAANLEIITI